MDDESKAVFTCRTATKRSIAQRRDVRIDPNTALPVVDPEQIRQRVAGLSTVCSTHPSQRRKPFSEQPATETIERFTCSL